MRRNNNALLIAFLLMLLMGIGYAILSSTLNINGITNISATSWDVHFENVAATSESNTTPTVAPSAPATSKVTTLTYEVTLNNPGDIYEFTVDVTNDGTIDAMIDSVDSKIKIGSGSWQTVSNSTLPDYLLYDVIYSNGMPIKQANSLKAGESKELLVHAEYRKDVTEEQMAEASNKTISFKVTINYKQAVGTEKEPAYEEPVYYQKMNSVEIQETSPEEPIYIAQYEDGNYGICFNIPHQCFKENNYVAEFKHAKATLFNEWNNCIYSYDYINAKSCKSGMISIILYNDGNIYGQLGSTGAINAIKCIVDHNENVHKCTLLM